MNFKVSNITISLIEKAEDNPDFKGLSFSIASFIGFDKIEAKNISIS